MTLDMSEVVQMIAAFGGGQPPELTEGMDSLNAVFDIRASKIRQVNGISNVRQEIDKENLVFSLLLDFDNIDALNRGMSEFYKDESTSQTKQYVFFKETKGNLERTEVNRVLDALNFAMNSEQVGQEFNPATLLGDMFYEQQISFERNIKSFSNNAYVQGDGSNWGEKDLRWKKYLFKSSDENKTIDVQVKMN